MLGQQVVSHAAAQDIECGRRGPRTRVPVLKRQSSHVFFKVLKEVKNLCSAQAYKEPCAKHEFRPIRGKKKKVRILKV